MKKILFLAVVAFALSGCTGKNIPFTAKNILAGAAAPLTGGASLLLLEDQNGDNISLDLAKKGIEKVDESFKQDSSTTMPMAETFPIEE